MAVKTKYSRSTAEVREKKVRALVCPRLGDLSALEVMDVPEPTPAPGEVVVAVRAATVDFADTLIAAGNYQIAVQAPYVPGNNVAGVIVDAGHGSSRFAIGDRVHGMSFIGGFAQQVVVPEASLRPTPPELPFYLACITGAPYRTAYDALISPGGLKSGDCVVVLGASGGVGSAAVLIAKSLGAYVVAAVSTKEKFHFASSLGADAGVLTSDLRFKQCLKSLCPEGADIVLDMVGGELSEPALRSVGYGGRFVVVGFAGGAPARVPLNVPLLKGSTITGYEIASFERREPAQAAANREALEALFVSRALVPPVTARFDLEEGPAAMRHVAGRDKHGVAVLHIS